MMDNLPEGVVAVTKYKARDGSEHHSVYGASSRNLELAEVEHANLMLNEGHSVWEAAQFLRYNKPGEDLAALRKVTKDTALVISHWQCRDQPGYQPCYFVLGGKLFVWGDAGSWSGRYGQECSLRDVARYYEDTVSRAASQGQEGAGDE